MIVYGKPLAERILAQLKETISEKHLQPHLAIILAGPDPSSRTYINAKIKKGNEIGIKTTLLEFSPSVYEECLQTLKRLNSEKDVHGIIVQLPLHEGWNKEELLNAVELQKDVDGFLPNSPFSPATANATWEMLTEFAHLEGYTTPEQFLQNKIITVLGKGTTAGKPIRQLLTTKGFESYLIDTKTLNPHELLQQSDLIISATGKKNIITSAALKQDVYLIGIGVGKEDINGEQMVYGDFDLNDVQSKAKLICPTINGIGPLTVACLLKNVTQAALDTK